MHGLGPASARPTMSPLACRAAATSAPSLRDEVFSALALHEEEDPSALADLIAALGIPRAPNDYNYQSWARRVEVLRNALFFRDYTAEKTLDALLQRQELARHRAALAAIRQDVEALGRTCTQRQLMLTAQLIDRCIDEVAASRLFPELKGETPELRASWVSALRTLKKKSGMNRMVADLETATGDGPELEEQLNLYRRRFDDLASHLHLLHETYRGFGSLGTSDPEARRALIAFAKEFLENVRSADRGAYLALFRRLFNDRFVSPVLACELRAAAVAELGASRSGVARLAHGMLHLPVAHWEQWIRAVQRTDVPPRREPEADLARKVGADLPEALPLGALIQRLEGLGQGGVEALRALTTEIVLSAEPRSASYDRGEGEQALAITTAGFKMRRLLEGLAARPDLSDAQFVELVRSFVSGLRVLKCASPAPKLEELDLDRIVAGFEDGVVTLADRGDSEADRASALAAFRGLRGRWRAPELLVVYRTRVEKDHPRAGAAFVQWTKALLGEDPKRDLEKLRYATEPNAVHFEKLSPGLVERWKTSKVATEDPETLFMLGEDVGSCQAITSGSMIRGLVGYLLNGNTKAVAITDPETGEISARAVVRLLFREDDGKPVVLAEKNYFGRHATGREAQTKRLEKHLRDLERELGIPVVRAATDGKVKAYQHGSLAPHLYCDSMWGARDLSEEEQRSRLVVAAFSERAKDVET